jgi:hypothetical protein
MTNTPFESIVEEDIEIDPLIFSDFIRDFRFPEQ